MARKTIDGRSRKIRAFKQMISIVENCDAATANKKFGEYKRSSFYQRDRLGEYYRNNHAQIVYGDTSNMPFWKRHEKLAPYPNLPEVNSPIAKRFGARKQQIEEKKQELTEEDLFEAPIETIEDLFEDEGEYVLISKKDLAKLYRLLKESNDYGDFLLDNLKTTEKEISEDDLFEDVTELDLEDYLEDER